MHVPGLPQFLSDTLTGSCFPLVINFAVPGCGSSRDVGVTLGEPSVHIGRHLLSSEHRAVFIRSASSNRLRTSRVVRGPQGTFAFRLAPRLNSLIFFFLSRLTFQFFFFFFKGYMPMAKVKQKPNLNFVGENDHCAKLDDLGRNKASF